MSVDTAEHPADPAPPQSDRGSGLARSNGVRALGALILLIVLGGAVFLSLTVGDTGLPLHLIWDAIFHFDGSTQETVVREDRLGRTLLGLLVGMSLAVAGALIQAMTRNPLADPGILGVNAGAALFVAIAVGTLGMTSFHSYVWFAFLGAVAATVLVYGIGSRGRGGATPIRLTLAGVAVTAVLGGITQGMMLLKPATFEYMAYWNAGTIGIRDSLQISGSMAGFILVGLLLAALVSRSLNAVALGDDLARSLGADVARTRTLGIIAVTLLCGATTAAAGPIGFVGLMVPHVARWIVGPEQRWILLYTLLGGPVLLLVSDVIGRLLGELQVGIVTAFIGAPVLIVLVRRRKASGL